MWITVILVLAILAALIYLDTKKPIKFPPGPPWLPFVGSLPYIAMKCDGGTNVLSDTLINMAKDYKTSFLGIKVGKNRMVVVCGYEALKEVLCREEFDGRPQGVLFDVRTWGKRRGIVMIDGPFWQSQRRFLLRHLKDYGYARQSMEELVKKEVSELAKHLMMAIKEAPGSNSDSSSLGNSSSMNAQLDHGDINSNKADGEATLWLHNAFCVSVLNTIWFMMAGVRYEPGDKELNSLQKILNDLFLVLDTTGTSFSHFPMLKYIAPEMSGYNLFVSTHQKIWDFLHRELERHKSTFQPDVCRDFMDVFLKKIEDEKKDGVQHPEYNDIQLLAVCMDMFMAGSETTSKGLGFAFLYLLTHPEVQRKAQAEIDAVVGRDRVPNLNDRSRMPYMEAVILETLRLFSSTSFGLAHRALSDSYIQGYFIPKDTMVLTSYASISMNEKLWGDPKNYRPERFLNDKGEIDIPYFHIPFGCAKRRCMGESLAKASIFLFISGLLQMFEFSVPDGEDPPSITACELTGITPTPSPYRATIKLRK